MQKQQSSDLDSDEKKWKENEKVKRHGKKVSGAKENPNKWESGIGEEFEYEPQDKRDRKTNTYRAVGCSNDHGRPSSIRMLFVHTISKCSQIHTRTHRTYTMKQKEKVLGKLFV